MELNVKQKSAVKVLYDTYKTDTVTRSQINDLVKKKKIANPSWLKSDKYKVDRGVYKLPLNNNTQSKKEVEENSVTVRKLGSNKQETIKREDFIKNMLTLNKMPLN